MGRLAVIAYMTGKIINIVLIALFVGAAIGYYIGYDIGFEKAVTHAI